MHEPAADPARQAHLRELLTAERRRTERTIAALEATVAGIVDGADLTATDDEHDPEGHTLAFERSQAGALLSSARARLGEVDQALRRLEDGGYGRCERCGEPIPAARLEARPAARTCVPCAAPGGRR